MIFMIEKSIRGAIFNAIPWCAKVIDKYMKYYDKNKESSNPMYWDMNKLQVWKTSQKLIVDGFQWIENISRFNEVS